VKKRLPAVVAVVAPPSERGRSVLEQLLPPALEERRLDRDPITDVRGRRSVRQAPPKNRHLHVTRELSASVLHAHFLSREKPIPDQGMSSSD
jgi:hypothetical protein